ncbi:MAG: FG-GAP-like repeat-containing protein [Candidatus Kapaibacterium sp.]
MKKAPSFLLILILSGYATWSCAQVTFKNVSNTAGISAAGPQSYSVSSIWVDIDNDDYLDLYVVHGSGLGDEFNQLFHNLRNGTFQDIRATAFPTATPAYTGQMCWGDFNNDGFIDCYESHFPTSTDHKLWMNNGDLTFKDVSNLFQEPGTYATGAIFSDINSDGKLDLLINTQHFQGTSIELNNGKSFDIIKPFFNGGQGDEILSAYINDDSIPDYLFGNARGFDSIFVSSGNSFITFDNSFLRAVRNLSDYPGAAAFADIDNDGFPDLLIHYFEKIFVFHNINGKEFVNWTADLGLDQAQAGKHNTVFLYDFDNDGYLDLLVINDDITSKIFYGSPTGFKTSSDLPMNDPPTDGGQNASLTDYDNDGFIDIQHNSMGVVELWHNEGNANRWLTVTLRGHKANSNGIGARIIAYSEGRRQNRDIGYSQGNYGYLPLMAHFGFGAPGCEVGSGVIDSVVVIWQPGGKQVIRNVPYNELAVIDQDSGIVRSIQRPVSVSYGYASPYFLGVKSVYADTVVTMPMSVAMPKNFVQQQIVADEITFGVEFNSDIIDITPSKVAQRYTPPTGWAYKSSVMNTDSLYITISNLSGAPIPDSVGLGSLRFDTYNSKYKSTYLFLNTLIIRVKGNEYKFCHDFEGDILGEVVIVDHPSVVTAHNSGSSWSLSVLPNPSTGNSVTVRYSSGQEFRSTEVSVFDVLGKEVYRSKTEGSATQTGIHTFTIPTSQLTGGTYLVRLNEGGEVVTGKFTVVK